MATKGIAAPEVEQTYARARALCAQVGETPQLFPTLWGLWRFYHNQGVLPTARELGEQLYAAGAACGRPEPLLEAYEALGMTLFFLGDFAAARMHLEQGIARIDPAAQRDPVLRHGEAPGVRCLAYMANTLWCLGYPAQAVQRSQEALSPGPGDWPIPIVWCWPSIGRPPCITTAARSRRCRRWPTLC